MNDYMQSYDLWLKKATDIDVQKSLRAMDGAEIKNAFSKDLSFGTGTAQYRYRTRAYPAVGTLPIPK